MELFDIMLSTSDPSSFEENERNIYLGQKIPERTGYISDQIDENYSLPVSTEIASDSGIATDMEENIEGCSGEQCEPIQTNEHSFHRSGLRRSRILSFNKCVQTDDVEVCKPKIRKVRNCTDDVKRVCSQISIECGLSVEKSRTAVKVVAKELYGHEFRLNAIETQETSDESVSMDNKRKHNETEQTAKRTKNSDNTPHSSAEYTKYQDVLPARRAIINYKHLQATESERQASLALYYVEP